MPNLRTYDFYDLPEEVRHEILREIESLNVEVDPEPFDYWTNNVKDTIQGWYDRASEYKVKAAA